MLAALLLLTLGGLFIADDCIDQYKPEGVNIYVNSASHTEKEKKNEEAKETYSSSYDKKINSDSKTNSDKKLKELDSYSIMTVDAEDWLCHYADNVYNDVAQEKIQKNWKDKFIKLKGKINNVHYDYLDGCRITIRQQRSKSLADGWCIIVCYFYDETEIEKVKELKKGDYVSILGYSTWNLGPKLIDSHIK